MKEFTKVMKALSESRKRSKQRRKTSCLGVIVVSQEPHKEG